MFLLENAVDVSAEVSSVVSAAAGEPAFFEKSGLANLAQDASFGDRLSYGLKYAAVGMVTVFMVLTIIMAVLYLFKLAYVITSKKKASATTAAPAVDNQAQTAASSADSEEELVAVATAAIAAYRGESDCAFNVISITKIQ